MGEHYPIASHIESQCSLVASRFNLLCFSKNRSHSGMRHICFEGDTSTRNWLSSISCYLSSHNDWPDPNRPGSNFKINSDRRPGKNNSWAATNWTDTKYCAQKC